MSTPRYGHEPIPMIRKESKDQVKEVGDFTWHFDEEGARFLWLATRWHDRPRIIAWDIKDAKNAEGRWDWDGNEDKPTLTPSLHAIGSWHGFVRNGELVEA